MPFGRMSWEGPEDASAPWRAEEIEEFDLRLAERQGYNEWWQWAVDASWAEIGEIQQVCGPFYAMWLDELWEEGK